MRAVVLHCRCTLQCGAAAAHPVVYRTHADAADAYPGAEPAADAAVNTRLAVAEVGQCSSHKLLQTDQATFSARGPLGRTDTHNGR